MLQVLVLLLYCRNQWHDVLESDLEIVVNVFRALGLPEPTGGVYIGDTVHCEGVSDWLPE